MLVLSRRKDEKLIIDGGRIIVTVIEIRTHNGLPRVRLGIEAPREITVDREEIHRKKDSERGDPGGDDAGH